MEKQYYYSSNGSLPVIFCCSAATVDDVTTGDDANAYANTPIINMIQRNYAELKLKYETFMGTHNGILNDAFSSGFDWISDQVDGPSD